MTEATLVFFCVWATGFALTWAFGSWLFWYDGEDVETHRIWPVAALWPAFWLCSLPYIGYFLVHKCINFGGWET